nr:MAG: hypothetical protein [Microvirus sp.]
MSATDGKKRTERSDAVSKGEQIAMYNLILLLLFDNALIFRALKSLNVKEC